MKDRTLWLHILLEKEKDKFIAHCLEFDIVTEGSSLEDAEESIIDAINEYITYAIENNLLNQIYRPAPKEIWEKILYAIPLKTMTIRPEPIKFAGKLPPLITRAEFNKVEELVYA